MKSISHVKFGNFDSYKNFHIWKSSHIWSYTIHIWKRKFHIWNPFHMWILVIPYVNFHIWKSSRIFRIWKSCRNTNFRPESPRKFHNSPNKSLILQISQFRHARAPCPQVGPPGVPGLSPVSSISIPTFWLRDWVNFKFFMTSWELCYNLWK
jgi:hypothetical protein